MSWKVGGDNDALKERLKNCFLYGHSSDECPCCWSRYDLIRLPIVNLKKRKEPKQKLVVKSATTLLESISSETMNLLSSHNAPIYKSYKFDLQDGRPIPTDFFKSDLPAIPPTLPSADQKLAGIEQILYIVSIQRYINKLGFLREGEPKIKVDTTKSIRYQMETAKQIINAGESIKCHQALLLAIYFTNCLSRIERFTISFKYTHKGKEYTHVVLGFTFARYGVLGISRHAVLQKLNRLYGFQNIAELMDAFKTSYKKLGQVLLEVKIGGFIPHDPRSLKHIDWNWRTLGTKTLEDPKEVDRLDEVLEWWIFDASIRHDEPERLAIKSRKAPAESETSSPSYSTEDYSSV